MPRVRVAWAGRFGPVRWPRRPIRGRCARPRREPLAVSPPAAGALPEDVAMQHVRTSQNSQRHVQWARAYPGVGAEPPACSQLFPPLTLPSPGYHLQPLMDGPGLTQIAQGAQVQLQHAGTPITVQERRFSQPHTQSGGTIYHLEPQSPAAAGGAGLQPLASPSHITTANLPPQISSIIQGQLVQQQQVLQGPPLPRSLGFERTPSVLLPGAGGAAGLGMTSPPPPTSPSRTAMPPGLSSLPLTSAGNTGVKKAPKKLEEIPPASPEMAQMRKQCLDYHYQEMQALKEVFKEYLIELFFLQHFQGNMMDFLAFKKKHYAPLQAYLRQNDLDIEEEEEEQEHSEIPDGEVKVAARIHRQPGTPVAMATQLLPRAPAAFSPQRLPLEVLPSGPTVQIPRLASLGFGDSMLCGRTQRSPKSLSFVKNMSSDVG
uniref:putative EP400-like protein n=1 Tax=Callithrix jacchus TaxID=9483 RepID=UPI0023DCF3F3|nr:putative EP400-like protein [Callithrix jacchus]